MGRFKSKNFMVFRDHLIPNIFKDEINRISQFYVMKSKSKTSKQSADHLLYHLDKSQEKRLRNELTNYKIKANQTIIQKAKQYIFPLEKCPSYFSMIIQSLRQDQKIKIDSYLTQYEKQFEEGKKCQKDKIYNTFHSKLLKQSYNLHPFMKFKIYQQFQKAYNKHKLENKQLVKLIGQAKIFYIPPLIYKSALQIFQKQHPILSDQESRQIFFSDKRMQNSYKSKMNKYIFQHKLNLQYIMKKTGLSIFPLLKLFQDQLKYEKQQNLHIYL